jgi:hypothetical protein
MMVLQNCMESLMVEPGSDSETCPTPSHDVTHIIDIKVEGASDIEAVKDPLLIPFPEVKVEHQVSCMSACPVLGIFHKYPELCTVFLISICLSVHMKPSPVC